MNGPTGRYLSLFDIVRLELLPVIYLWNCIDKFASDFEWDFLSSHYLLGFIGHLDFLLGIACSYISFSLFYCIIFFLGTFRGIFKIFWLFIISYLYYRYLLPYVVCVLIFLNAEVKILMYLIYTIFPPLAWVCLLEMW